MDAPSGERVTAHFFLTKQRRGSSTGQSQPEIPTSDVSVTSDSKLSDAKTPTIDEAKAITSANTDDVTQIGAVIVPSNLGLNDHADVCDVPRSLIEAGGRINQALRQIFRQADVDVRVSMNEAYAEPLAVRGEPWTSPAHRIALFDLAVRTVGEALDGGEWIAWNTGVPTDAGTVGESVPATKVAPEDDLEPEVQGRVSALLNGAMRRKHIGTIVDLVIEFRDRPWFPALYEAERKGSGYLTDYDRALEILEEAEAEYESEEPEEEEGQ